MYGILMEISLIFLNRHGPAKPEDEGFGPGIS
jgi:hypothetical protein